MGADTSKFHQGEIEELRKCTHFTEREIQRLFLRFTRLDKDKSGTVSTSDLMSIPELAMNPLVSRIVGAFDPKKSDEVTFKKFVSTLSVFSERASRDEKLQLTFNVYDINGDGEIDRKELYTVVKMMVGDNLEDNQVYEIVDKTIKEANKEGNEKITFEEFCVMMEGTDVERRMTIKF